jgi:hypothetical protein
LSEDKDPEITNDLVDSIEAADLEVASDTFNPSALFDDKSQAEWFGNIVYNREQEALRAIVAAAAKMPRWVWFLVFFAGALVGFIFFAWASGSFVHTGATAATSGGSALPIPPPPGSTTTTTTTHLGG